MRTYLPYLLAIVPAGGTSAANYWE